MGYDIFKAAIAKKTGLTIYFVRHGQSDGDTLGEHCPVHQDSHLTSLGKQQATAVGRYFAGLPEPITTIYTSLRERAVVTANAITAATGVSAHTSDRLTERDWGIYNGYTWVSMSERLDRLSFEERFAYLPDDGESWEMMEDRLFGVLAIAVEAAAPTDSLVVVTHSGCLRALLPLLDGQTRHEHSQYNLDFGCVSKYVAATTDTLEYHNLVPELYE